jgi:transketolase
LALDDARRALAANAAVDLDHIARQVRGRIVSMSVAGDAAHLASSLSCVDILVAAYWKVLRIDPARPDDPERDRFILSKGHAAQALYATLAKRGFVPDAMLDTYNRDGTKLAEHPGPGCMPGVEAATGSLGHGLPIGLGIALGNRIQQRDARVFVLLSDGECNEGSVWEAAMMAAAQRAERLSVIIDFNGWQATDRSREVMAIDPLVDKWTAFGWSASEIDGHDPEALARVLARVPDGNGRPVALVAHTIKGKGVSFMEDDNNWHYRIPTPEEVRRAHRELGLL